jgi:L-ascorbate metabolism protein UlaG (beta-lactamase superfamily)
MEVTWIGHATVLLEIGGLRVLTDPVLGRRVFLLRRVAPPVPPSSVEDIDVVLISHAHADHLDPRSVRRLLPVGDILAPRGAREYLSRHGVPRVQEVRAGSEAEIGGVTIQTVHALHDGRRWDRGPAREAVGFVVRGSVSVYFAGDTDVYPEMAGLKGSIDVALLPVWGWGRTLGEGHMNPDRAVEALTVLAPRVAIPIHWGTLGPPPPIPALTDLHGPARAFAYRAATVAPDVDVRVLEPGESTTVEAGAVVPAPPS